MLDHKLLSIYLNDHLAGSTAGLELAKRARGSNEGSELGELLTRLVDEIEGDRESLEGIMESLEVGRDHPKVLAAWTAEKLGRLKPNGQITGYSPLSRLVELEGLVVGIRGKLGLWHALLEVAEQDPRLDVPALTRLAERAERQQGEVEQQRLLAARGAFAGETAAA